MVRVVRLWVVGGGEVVAVGSCEGGEGTGVASYLLEVEVTFSSLGRLLLLPEDGSSAAPPHHHALCKTEQDTVRPRDPASLARKGTGRLFAPSLSRETI